MAKLPGQWVFSYVDVQCKGTLYTPLTVRKTLAARTVTQAYREARRIWLERMQKGYSGDWDKTLYPHSAHLVFEVDWKAVYDTWHAPQRKRRARRVTPA